MQWNIYKQVHFPKGQKAKRYQVLRWEEPVQSTHWTLTRVSRVFLWVLLQVNVPHAVVLVSRLRQLPSAATLRCLQGGAVALVLGSLWGAAGEPLPRVALLLGHRAPLKWTEFDVRWTDFKTHQLFLHLHSRVTEQFAIVPARCWSLSRLPLNNSWVAPRRVARVSQGHTHYQPRSHSFLWTISGSQFSLTSTSVDCGRKPEQPEQPQNPRRQSKNIATPHREARRPGYHTWNLLSVRQQYQARY